MSFSFLDIQASEWLYVSIKETISKSNMNEAYRKGMDANYACLLMSSEGRKVSKEEKKREIENVSHKESLY